MLALQQSALMLSHARRQGDLLRHGYRVDVDLSSHVVVVELEADATGDTADIIAGPVPMPIKPRGARWTPLFQPCRCRVLARRVLWNWRTLKVHNGELYMCNYCLAAHTTCHCVRPCCIWACTAARCVPIAAARSAIEEFIFSERFCASCHCNQPNPRNGADGLARAYIQCVGARVLLGCGVQYSNSF